jgi:Fe-S-cluster-containing hydrogenase component 2
MPAHPFYDFWRAAPGGLTMAHEASHAVTVESLRSLPVFADLPNPALDQLLRASEVRQLDHRQRLSSLERGPGESYCFVLSGVVSIAMDREDTTVPARLSGERSFEHIGFFGQGDFFSDGFLDCPPGAGEPGLDCMGCTPTTLLAASRPALAAIMARHAAWSARLGQQMAASRNHFLSQQEPTRRLVQDFFLRHGFASSSLVRVTQLDRCLDCNKCQEACARRHGSARGLRADLRLGRLAIQKVCRQCVDRPCLASCKVQALALDERGEIRISERCTGCGACVRKCPHGAIFTVKYVDALKTRQRAVKCDHCAGFTNRACFNACPTGALLELSPQELFTEAGSGSSGSARNFSGVAFLEGVAEHRARQTRPTARAVVAALLFLALAAVGLEAFLRRTLPERSLQAALLQWLGRVEPISYSSGKGFGHWLGYIGTSFMLLTLLYPLHTRLGLLKKLGAQSNWLTVHLWVGFIGATLVTYHAAFKLDRWVGLSCMSMWIVVASGAIGRYLYGKVHSGIGLTDFETESLTRSAASIVGHRRPSRAMLILTPEHEGAVGSHGLLAVMLWHELRDFAALFWLRFAGLSDVPDHKTRRQIRQFLSDRAAQRRTRSYLESAKKMLRHWNWVHIILTIIMFGLAGVHIAYGFMYKAV